MKKTTTLTLAALALTLTACSENDGTTGTPNTTAATTEATEETTVEQATEPDTIATSSAQQETNSSPAPAFDSEEWGYAPYGHDEYGLPHVPDHATDFERCSMLAGMECTNQMMSEWQAINDYAATQQDRNAGQSWWGECIAENTAEYCRANDPWQQ